MKNTMRVMGASNLTDKDRSAHDYYGTDPRSTKALLEKETFSGRIWEPCAGHHLIANTLKDAGYQVQTSDLYEYEGVEHDAIIDFLKYEGTWDGDIVTNPPYNLSTDCAKKALEILQPGKKLAMFLRLQYLEGAKRYETIFKDTPPKAVYVFINRQTCNADDDFTIGSAVAYCWFVWEKGYTGEPTLRWLRTDK